MADVTLTVNSDKTIGLSTQSLGSQGERVSVDVVVPAAVAALGYEAYIDFLLPDGVSYYKGGYDCSSAAFTFGLGETDSVMDLDGEVQVQFWVGTIVAAVKTVYWATSMKKTKVNKSIGATSAAVLPYVPQMVYPSTFPADLIALEDAANRFTATNAEQGLAEIAGAGRTSETVKANAAAIISLSTQPAKINASLINSWVGTAWYFKDTIGFVHLYISVSGGTGGFTIATLPVGYRPPSGLGLIGINTSTKAAILGEIQTNGNIEGDNPTAGTLYSPPPYLPA